MGRVKQSKLNSSRTRTRLRATPEGRHLQQEMAAKGRTVVYREPKRVLRDRLRQLAKEAREVLDKSKASKDT